MRRPAWSLLPLVLLVSCTRCGGSKPGPTVTPDVLPSSATSAPATGTVPAGPAARLAYTAGASLCVQNVLPTTLGEAICTKLPAAGLRLRWAGGERVAALLTSDDVVLVSVAQGKEGVKKLPLPAASTWDQPPPRDQSGNIENGATRSTSAHLFVKGDEVWIAKCPWWFPMDAGWCHEWVSARLYPSSAVEVSSADPPGFRERSTPHFAGSPPADVKITVKAAEEGKSPPIVCERGNARSIFVLEDAISRMTAEWTWIPESASFYLANVTYDNGEAVTTTTYLMKACESKPVKELSSVIMGPGAYWIHRADTGWTVRYGDRELGVLNGDDPEFAPSPP